MININTIAKKGVKATVESIFERPQYRSIINILIAFDIKEGLSPIYFRYALEKGYRHSKDPRVQFTVYKLNKFFGEKLKDLIATGRVIPDCITSRSSLGYFLDSLYRPPICAVDKTGNKEKNGVRYRIKEEFQFATSRVCNKEVIDSYNVNQICWGFDDSSKPTRHHVVYGFPRKLSMECIDKTKDDIKTSLNEINKHIEKLQGIRDRTLKTEQEKRVKQFYKKTKSSKIKQLIRDRGIKICNKYPPAHEKFPKIEQSFVLNRIYQYHNSKYTRLKEDSPFFILMDPSDESKWQSMVHFNKDYSFSKEDRKEIVRWWEKNNDIVDVSPLVYSNFAFPEDKTNYKNVIRERLSFLENVLLDINTRGNLGMDNQLDMKDDITK